MSPVSAPSAPPDWDAPERVRAGVAPGLVGLAAAGTLGAIVWGLVSAPGGLAVAVVTACVWSAWVVTRGPFALKAIDATRMEPDAEPRFRNLVAGAAADLGTGVPQLWVIPSGRVNALVAWQIGTHHLAVTEGALRTLNRTELEAVVAHSMVRIASGEARRATLALALGPLGRSLVRVGPALDVRTAALTRYPPALAAALRRCEAVGDRDLEPLLLVAEGPTHAGREDRAEALLDL